jgi:formylglycine-generating enzyme required for sulfatase activity
MRLWGIDPTPDRDRRQAKGFLRHRLLAAVWVLGTAGCGAAFSADDIAAFDALASFEGTVDIGSSTVDVSDLRVAFLWSKADKGIPSFEVAATAAVDDQEDGVRFKIGLVRLPRTEMRGVLETSATNVPPGAAGEEVALGAFVLYEDVGGDSGPDLKGLGDSGGGDRLLGVSHRHAVWYFSNGAPGQSGPFAVRELDAPCFPELSCGDGQWLSPRVGQFSRPQFSGITISVDGDLAAGGCTAGEEVAQFGKCHQLRQKLTQYLDTECALQDEGCPGNTSRSQPTTVFAKWHADLLEGVRKESCCVPDLGARPWYCSPVLGCPEGYGCCDGLCSQDCTNGKDQVWVKIPAGQFQKGSPLDEMCRDKGEDLHTVTLTRPFLIATTEVTRPQFLGIMGYDPSTWFGSAEKDMRLPVSSVSWAEAAAFCNQLSATAGLDQCYTCEGSGENTTCSQKTEYRYEKLYACPGYRLPTDAEWEYAYRAGTQTAFYNGPITSCETDALAGKIAWYNDFDGTPRPVGGKVPNAWGLYDMAGNVEEWVADWYAVTAPGVSKTDPFDRYAVGGSSPTFARPVRGGDFSDSAYSLRGGYRSVSDGTRWETCGFRCAKSAAGTP